MSVPCGVCGDEVPSEHGLKIHYGKKHPGKKPPPKKTAPAPAADAGEPIAEDSPFAGPAVEVAPKEKPPAWRERLWGAGPDRPAKAKTERDRRPQRRRVSTEHVWTGLYGTVGTSLARYEINVPVGNCLTFQAPVAGPILDELIRGTWFDRWVQPLATGGEKLQQAADLFGPPILVEMMRQRPETAPMLMPALRQMIRRNVVLMGPVVKKRQKEDDEYRRTLDEMGVNAGDDPINDVIAAIFPLIPEPATNGQYAPAGAAANGT